MDTFKLRFVPLGGIVSVTKNMYVYELYKNDLLEDILIIDCGIGFPQEKELGVDFVIPDISYLQDKKDKIRALLLTHGHEDHITAVPYHYKELNEPEVYGSRLTLAFVENKAKEFNIRIKSNLIKFGQQYKLGHFNVSFIETTHSIPDTTHIFVTSPAGNIYHGSDFKLDLNPPFGHKPNFYEMCRAGKLGVDILLSDCLGSERHGLTESESMIGQSFENEMRKARGKFIMTTFSSNISRIRQCVDAAIKFNRKIVFVGRSMRDNAKMAQEIKYLPIPFDMLAKEQEVSRLPPKKVCVIAAGSQGQYSSALSKIARKQNKFIKIKPGDKVVFSSDPIPGNEDEVTSVIEDLTLQGADVVYSAIHDQLHTSGHGNMEDLKFLMRFTEPRYFIPIGGTIRHQRQYQRLAEELGYRKESVFLLNEGETVFLQRPKAYKGESVTTKSIFVDANGVGDVGAVVLRDRKTIAEEGILFVMLVLDQDGKLIARPRLISKGFIFEQAEAELMEEAMKEVERVMQPGGQYIHDKTGIKKHIVKTLEQFIFAKKGRQPLIVVEVVHG